MNGTAERELLPAKNSALGETGLWGGIPGYKGRWFVSRKIKELGLQAAYDVFVITRSDHYYGCQHNISEFFDPSALWLPSGEDWGGFTNISGRPEDVEHLVVGKDLVFKALDIGPFYHHFYQAHVRTGLFHRKFWPVNPEILLKYIWENVHGLSILLAELRIN